MKREIHQFTLFADNQLPPPIPPLRCRTHQPRMPHTARCGQPDCEAHKNLAARTPRLRLARNCDAQLARLRGLACKSKITIKLPSESPLTSMSTDSHRSSQTNPHAYAQYGSQTQTKDTMWKPKNEEIVFSLKVTKDFRFTSTKLEWANNDKVLQRALEQGVIFRYADEALELCRKMNYLIDNFKNSENEK